MKKKPKKPFKDTAVGQLLTQKIPNAAKVIGNVLPNSGVLGIARNLLDVSDMDEMEKEELRLQLIELETEILTEEIKDKESARKREIAMAQLGKMDLMFHATGFTLLASFAVLVYAIVFLPIPEGNKATFTHLVGMIEGAVIGGPVFYYFGTSKKTKDTVDRYPDGRHSDGRHPDG